MRAYLCALAALVAGCTNSIAAPEESIEIGETIEHEISTDQGTAIERYLVQRAIVRDGDVRYEVVPPSGDTRRVSYELAASGETVTAVLDASGAVRVRAVAAADGPTELCVGTAGCVSRLEAADAFRLREDLTLLALDLRASPVVGLQAIGVQADDAAYEWWEVGVWWSSYEGLGYWGGYWNQRNTIYWYGQPVAYCMEYFSGDPTVGDFQYVGTDWCQSIDT